MSHYDQLGIHGYHSNDVPQFLNLTSTTVSLRSNILGQDEREFLLFYEAVPENTQRRIPRAGNRKLFGTFSPCSAKYLKDEYSNVYFARKYAHIFVLGNYLFLEAYGFSRVPLSEN